MGKKTRRRLVGAALAASLGAAAGARAQVVAGRPAVLARAAAFAPAAPSALGTVLPLSLAPPAPVAAAALAPAPVNALGVRGPGITDAHAASLQDLADQTGRAWFVHGSRQTGVSYHTKAAFTDASDLDLGVVGRPEDMVTAYGERWDGIPDAKHGPMSVVDSVEDAVGRGHFVVAPRSWEGPPAARGSLRELSAPYRTAAQLTRLAEKPRAAGESFRFTVIGDAEAGRFWFARALFNRDPGVFWGLLRRADRAGADFILQLGDMVSRGIAENFLSFFRRLTVRTLSTPFLTAIGNHERHKPHGVSNDRVYREIFGGTDYAFERGGWRFVVLDTSAGLLTPGQLEWLDETLRPGMPTVVFTHMPPAPLGEWTDFGRFKGRGGFKQGSEAFMRLMSERKVVRVYVGHMHAFGTLVRGGVRYVLTGGGGSPLFPGPVKRRFHHYLTVEVGPEGLAETVHLADGTSFDP